jgi:hypothetical protein
MKSITNFFKKIKTNIGNDLDKIIGIKYIVININSTSDIQFNDWNYWKNIYIIFDYILNKLELNQKSYIRSFQSFKTESNWLGFGRMKWSKENNQKWTQKYKSEEYSNKVLEFFDTEIWSPDWNDFDKTGNSPKFFSKVYHENENKGIVLALDIRLYESNTEIIEKSIQEIQKIIPNSSLNIFKRNWKPSAGFYNNLIDITYIEIQKVISKE